MIHPFPYSTLKDWEKDETSYLKYACKNKMVLKPHCHKLPQDKTDATSTRTFCFAEQGQVLFLLYLDKLTRKGFSPLDCYADTPWARHRRGMGQEAIPNPHEKRSGRFDVLLTSVITGFGFNYVSSSVKVSFRGWGNTKK